MCTHRRNLQKAPRRGPVRHRARPTDAIWRSDLDTMLLFVHCWPDTGISPFSVSQDQGAGWHHPWCVSSSWFAADRYICRNGGTAYFPIKSSQLPPSRAG